MKKVIIAALTFVALSSVAQAQTVFTCTTNKGKVVSVEQTGPQYYEYNYGLPGFPELHLEVNDTPELQGPSRLITFKNGDYDYQVSTDGETGEISVFKGHGDDARYVTDLKCNKGTVKTTLMK